MSPPAHAVPRGLSLWLLVALPLVAQLAFVAIGAAVLAAAVAMPTAQTSFYSLPQALLLLGAYLVFGLAIYFVARRLGCVTDVLALRRVPIGPSAGLAAIGLVGAILVAALLEPLFHGAASQHLEQPPFPGTLSAGVAVTISVLTVVGGAAISEEVYFRGLLLGRLDERRGRAAAIVASAGAFGLVHFQPDAFPTLFALGLILGLLRIRTRAVWSGIAVHATNNAIAVAAVLLAAS